MDTPSRAQDSLTHPLPMSKHLRIMGRMRDAQSEPETRSFPPAACAAELASRLARIDAIFGGSPFRRLFRAALCRHYGDGRGEHREMCAMMGEAGDWHGMRDSEIRHLTMPPLVFLSREPHRPN